MATTKIINDLIDLNQTGNTTALKGCVGTNANQPTAPTISVQYLVLGGGAGGGTNGTASGDGLGGGGAGGLSTGTIAVPNNTAVNIVIGQGGAGGTTTNGYNGLSGVDSGFYQIQGQGGGGGGAGTALGLPGGSGGGGGRNTGNLTNTSTGVSGQGNAGGLGGWSSTYYLSSGGGGGGKGSVGAGGGNDQSSGGAGGSGYDAVPSGIITQANAATAGVGETNGAERNFAGGGGGGQANVGTVLGGSGGGGNGGANSVGSPGTANTGGGGGGDGSTSATGGGSGGSGVVILRFASSTTETIAGSLGTTGVCNYPTTATALYQLNDNATDTCLNYNLTEVGTPTYAAGKFGKAISFNGTSQGTTSTSALVSSPAMTISFWYNGNGIAAISTQYIIGAGINSSCQGPSVGYYNGGFFGIIIDSGNNVGSATGPTTVSTSSWNNVVFTWDGTTTANACKIYLNGALDVEFTSTSSASSIGAYTPFGIGQTGASVGTASYAEGLVDQVRIFPSALTADQVAMLYAENVGATKFTEGSDTVLVFKGGSGTINLTGSSVLGPKVGDLRTNTDQSSTNSAASAMEHYISTGWRVFDNAPPVALENFNTVLYTGNGVSGNSITGVGFQPDMVWVKATDATYDPVLASVVNTQDYYLTTSETYIESVGNGRFSSFDTDGFTVTDGTSASNPAVINNKASTNYVSWNWKAGGPAVSNGNGSITTQVSANVNAGFSVISYTGNNTAGATVPHGLNALPELIIWKGATHVSGWKVYCNQFSSPTTEIIELYLSGGVSTNTTFIDGTAPGLEFITLGAYGDTNSLGNTMIAYCFHSVAGYSKIGSYTGNGSTTGPIVTTGFEPAFLMIKITTGSDSWFMIDNKRSTTNPRGNRLFADTSAAEASEPGAQVNFNATGFQLTGSGGGQGQTNSSGSGYMYLAIA